MDLGYFETSLPVRDIGASMAFYEAVGFERTEYAEDAGMATMIRGDCRLGLFQGHLDPDRAQLIFWQGPVEAVAGKAARAGLHFRRALQHDAEGGAGFRLDDPDGHPLHLLRMKTSPSKVPPDGLAIDRAFGWYLASLPVADMDRSVAFYEALGFRVADRMPDNSHVTLQNADCRLGLYQGHLQLERFQMIFWQGDIDALADHMRGAGLAFRTGPNGSGDHASFMLEDPDGHPLFFIRMPGVTRPVPADDPSPAPAVASGTTAPLARFIDRETIEYVRTYAHPVERVFKAVIDEAEVAAWFFPPAQIDARPGGAYALGGSTTDFKGVITAFEPPRFVRYGGPEPHGPRGYWQFELTPAPGGTQMRFVQHSQPGVWRNTHGWPAEPPEHPAGELNPWRPGTLSGWHISFDHLGDLMDGAPMRRVDEPTLEVRYRALMRETQP